jgi:hypothetical protein
MKRYFTLFLCMGLLLIFSAACKDQSLPAEGPDIGIPAEEMNTKVQLSVPDGWNTFKIGDIVGIAVKVSSNDQVAFAQDYGARMFLYRNEEWVEIPNIMHYPEGHIILSPAGNDPFKEGEAGVDPILPDEKQPATIRIYLVGHIYRDGQITPEVTASYIDVELEP